MKGAVRIWPEILTCTGWALVALWKRRELIIPDT